MEGRKKGTHREDRPSRPSCRQNREGKTELRGEGKTECASRWGCEVAPHSPPHHLPMGPEARLAKGGQSDQRGSARARVTE